MTRCPGYARHWFVTRGTVGLRAPSCIRCGVPNPRPLTQQEQADYDGYRDQLAEIKAAAIEELWP